MTRRNRRQGLRAVVTALLVAPLSAVMVSAAPSALASGEKFLDPTPGQDSVLSGGDSVTVKGQISEGTGSTTLHLVGPDADSTYPWSCPNDTNYFSTRTCASSMSPVSLTANGAPRRNGKWTLTLKNGNASLTRVFYTSVAPGTPTELTAQGTGASQVDLTWKYAGTEPDLQGFEISDGTSTTKIGNDACVGGSCATTVYYSNPEPGTYPYSFKVKALRPNGQGTGTVAGGESNAASAELVTPVPPSPTPAPTSPASPGASPGPSGSPAPGGPAAPTTAPGGGSGGTGTGGGKARPTSPALSVPSLNPVVAQRRSYALRFNSFSPSLGIPKLPPLPATTFTAAAEGSYQQTLPYEDRSQSEEPGSVLADPIAAVTSLDSAQLAKSLAFALILLGAAAHVRLFVNGHKVD